MYYRSIETGKYFIPQQLAVFKEVYDCEDVIEWLVEVSVLEKVEKPDLIDMVKTHSKRAAIERYMEMHNCDVTQARKMVGIMAGDMERFQKKKNK